MENTTNEPSYGARSVANQAEGVPRPVPRMDVPLATGHLLFEPIICTSPPPCIPNVDDPIPRPGGCGRYLPKKKSLNIVHFNICGLSTKKDEFKVFLYDNKIDIALLQETQHTAETNLNITRYTHYPCECTNCQGAITYIKNTITGKV